MFHKPLNISQEEQEVLSNCLELFMDKNHRSMNFFVSFHWPRVLYDLQISAYR